MSNVYSNHTAQASLYRLSPPLSCTASMATTTLSLFSNAQRVRIGDNAVLQNVARDAITNNYYPSGEDQIRIVRSSSAMIAVLILTLECRMGRRIGISLAET